MKKKNLTRVIPVAMSLMIGASSLAGCGMMQGASETDAGAEAETETALSEGEDGTEEIEAESETTDPEASSESAASTAEETETEGDDFDAALQAAVDGEEINLDEGGAFQITSGSRSSDEDADVDEEWVLDSEDLTTEAVELTNITLGDDSIMGYWTATSATYFDEDTGGLVTVEGYDNLMAEDAYLYFVLNANGEGYLAYPMDEELTEYEGDIVVYGQGYVQLPDYIEYTYSLDNGVLKIEYIDPEDEEEYEAYTFQLSNDTPPTNVTIYDAADYDDLEYEEDDEEDDDEDYDDEDLDDEDYDDEEDLDDEDEEE